jgi:hypothetical protein
MDRGVVLRGPYPFFFDTHALEIQHPQFIARYCEIAQKAEVKVGDAVKEGQVIAFVGDQPGDDMLHLEFFTGKLTGDLSYKPGTHPPYDRRDDVFNGVKFLDQTIATVSYKPGEKPYRYWTDNDGRKYLQAGSLQLIDI